MSTEDKLVNTTVVSTGANSEEVVEDVVDKARAMSSNRLGPADVVQEKETSEVEDVAGQLVAEVAEEEESRETLLLGSHQNQRLTPQHPRGSTATSSPSTGVEAVRLQQPPDNHINSELKAFIFEMITPMRFDLFISTMYMNIVLRKFLFEDQNCPHFMSPALPTIYISSIPLSS